MNTETDIRKLEDVLCICFHGKNPTHTQIVEKAKFLWHTFLQEFNEEDLDKIIEYVEYNIPIASFEAESLVDEDTQSEWLTQELYDETPKYAYRRYAQYLRQQGFAEDTIAKIELNCKKVLSYSANPLSTCDKKRGLVVGDVQAGKTANYTALINLACDFGYKIIVLLAGLTDSLREQTQTRIDEGFIGALSETIGGQTIYIGVGQEKSDYFAIPLTNSKNDFLKFIKDFLLSIRIKRQSSVRIPCDGIVTLFAAVITSRNPEHDPKSVSVEHIIFCYVVITHLHTFPFCYFRHFGAVQSCITLYA